MASGLLVLPGVEPALSDSGGPVSGATLTVYLAGTTTLASLFADAALGTAITNPQTSNSAGRFFQQSSTIFANSANTYDCVLAYPSTGQSFTFSGIPLVGTAVDISGLAPLNSPFFTGDPRAPTPALNDSDNSIATTAFVKGQNYAPLNSPAFTGTPTAPTAAQGTNTTQLATTAFVATAVGVIQGATGKLAVGTTLIQWGTANVVSSAATVTLPTAYVNTSYVIQLSPTLNGGTGGQIANIGTINTTGFAINGAQAGSGSPANFTCHWTTFGQTA